MSIDYRNCDKFFFVKIKSFVDKHQNLTMEFR